MPQPSSNSPDAMRRTIEELSRRVARLEARAITSINGKKPDKIGTVLLGLEELSDVQITSKTAGDLIVWDDGLQAYVNEAAAP
jgi:hypothetical protein